MVSRTPPELGGIPVEIAFCARSLKLELLPMLKTSAFMTLKLLTP